MQARMRASEKLANDADEALSRAEKAIADSDPKALETAAGQARKFLADPDAQLYPEYEMLQSRYKEDWGKINDVKKAREKKDLEAAIAQRHDKLEELSARVKKAVKALDTPTLDKAAVDELAAAQGELTDALKDTGDLEAKDKAFADYVKKQRDLAERSKEPLTTARARLDYVAGPVALRDQAAAKFKDGKAAKKNDDKIALLTEARALYDQCEDASRKLLMAAPAMSRLPITAAGQKTTPEGLDTACSKEWQDVDKALSKLLKGKKKK
jgi:hypothetical protein